MVSTRAGASGVMLHCRRTECDTIDRLLEDARGGQSGVLVLSGEAGVGKTALLEYAIGSAPDLKLLRAAGVQSEMELAFAALHQFCVPLLDSLDRLPGPQSDALRTTFGLEAGVVPVDRAVVLLVERDSTPNHPKRPPCAEQPSRVLGPWRARYNPGRPIGSGETT